MTVLADIPRRGVLFILSSPSGAGKTTLSRLLLEGDRDITMSVSTTTRPPRTSEVPGRDYNFVDRASFDRMTSRGAFLEWAEVHGNCYGTPRDPVEEAIAEGRDMLFDIDWQGAEQVRAALSSDVVSVFILPPSIAELERRLRGRALDSEEVIQRRLAKAQDEMAQWQTYDYVLINHKVADSLDHLRAILLAERLRRTRQTGLAEFMSSKLGVV